MSVLVVVNRHLLFVRNKINILYHFLESVFFSCLSQQCMRKFSEVLYNKIHIVYNKYRNVFRQQMLEQLIF